MKRKDFLQKSILGAGGIYFLPWFLAGCKKENPYETPAFKGSVGIIGAGAAGIYAAYLLQQYGVNVEIFEASDQAGGRMYSLTGFSDFSIDLGAEEIRGERSIWYDAVRSTSAQRIATPESDYYYYNGNLYPKNQFSSLPGYPAFDGLISGIRDYNGADISALAYANVNALDESFLPFFNALVGNKKGTDHSRISISGLARAESEWSAGGQSFILTNKDIRSAFLEVFGSAVSRIRLNTPIRKVNYTGGQVILTDEAGNEYAKSRVIITSSVNVLSAQMIDFTPGLPPHHLQAIGTTGMNTGMTIALKFQQPFWPSDMRSLYMPGPVPEFRNSGGAGRSAASNVLTAYVNGTSAENLLLLGDDMISSVLQQLDTCFGEGTASTSLIEQYVKDWGAEPYIRGVASFPSPGASADVRSLLADPINNRIYFAGEACAPGGHHGTVHGALESALFTVTKLIQTA